MKKFTRRIKKQIEDCRLEMIRIHENTLWYSISEEKANLLGDRIEFLDNKIEKLKELLKTN